MATDITERGLERLVCTRLAGHPFDPPAEGAVVSSTDCRFTFEFGHIRRVNVLLGLFVPALVTPLELIGGSDEAESK